MKHLRGNRSVFVFSYRPLVVTPVDTQLSWSSLPDSRRRFWRDGSFADKLRTIFVQPWPSHRSSHHFSSKEVLKTNNEPVFLIEPVTFGFLWWLTPTANHRGVRVDFGGEWKWRRDEQVDSKVEVWSNWTIHSTENFAVCQTLTKSVRDRVIFRLIKNTKSQKCANVAVHDARAEFHDRAGSRFQGWAQTGT